MKNKYILIFILLLGFLLRIVGINSSPPSLYGDELTITLDSYSLLKTGQDQLGNPFPLTFKMGAGRPAGYVYGTMPFVALFGPTALGVRALSILSGIGIIILLYLIGRKLFSEKIGLLAAGLVAISPWDISLSRGGFEAHFALLLALLGLYLFIKAKEKPLFYILSALSFGLALHTYPTYKASLILFLPLMLWYQGAKRSRRYFLMGVLILTFSGALAFSQTFIGGSEERFSTINVFSKAEYQAGIEQKINYERQISALPPLISKFFHNKPIEYSKVLIENYMQNFSLEFLFIHGDRNPRHNMATMGGLYAVEIILIIFGALILWQKQKKILIFFLCWMLIAPIPTAIIDLPHALRSSFMLPPLILISAFGLAEIINKRNKIVLSLILITFMIQFIFFTQKLFFLGPGEYSSFWSYPAKLAVGIAGQEKNNYDYVVISDRINDIAFAYPVYTKLEPTNFIEKNKEKSNLLNYSVKKYDNVYIIGPISNENIQGLIDSLDGSVLFIGTPDSFKYLRHFEIINNKDNLPAITLSRKEKINLIRLSL